MNIKTNIPGLIIHGRLESMKQVDDFRNEMIKGNYPASISDCEVCGINGDCGPNCPVLLELECPHCLRCTDDNIDPSCSFEDETWCPFGRIKGVNGE